LHSSSNTKKKPLLQLSNCNNINFSLFRNHGLHFSVLPFLPRQACPQIKVCQFPHHHASLPSNLPPLPPLIHFPLFSLFITFQFSPQPQQVSFLFSKSLNTNHDEASIFSSPPTIPNPQIQHFPFKFLTKVSIFISGQSFIQFFPMPPQMQPFADFLRPAPDSGEGRTPPLNRTVKKTLVVEESSLDNPDLGPFLLKMARETIASGESPVKALDFAIRASKSFERCAGPGLELATCLHVVAAIHSSLGRLDEAVEALERSILLLEGENESGHAMAQFSGYMQLGDTYSMIGQLDRAISCYESGLKIQMDVLGESDPRIAETCR